MTAGNGARLIRAPELAPAPYAYASIVPAGAQMVYLAGACPIDPAGQVLPLDDIPGQAAQCLKNLEIALAASGATIADVVSTRVLVAASDSAKLGSAWHIVHDWFGEHDVPSTLIGVTVLGYDGQLVEIEAIAAITPATER